MTGHRFSKVLEEDKPSTGHEECLALVYEGVDAVAKIREILGTTDPSKARPGSVRREFGSNIMVNAAHASDSPENALREMEIIRVDEENLTPWIKQYCT
jgi:nucleoside diphosphate kinase